MPEEIIYPKLSTNIRGATARALGFIQRPPDQQFIMPVRDAIEIDKALSDPGNTQHCPLCDDFFGTEAFIAHAQQCIDIHAPRKRTWMPPGFANNSIVNFKDKIKPDFVIEAELLKDLKEKES